MVPPVLTVLTFLLQKQLLYLASIQLTAIHAKGAALPAVVMTMPTPTTLMAGQEVTAIDAIRYLSQLLLLLSNQSPLHLMQNTSSQLSCILTTLTKVVHSLPTPPIYTF